MLRKTSILITATLLACSGLANAALDSFQDTFEFGLSEVRLPAYSGGNVVIRACPECEPELRRVTGSTVYRLGSSGPEVSLREFREAAGAAASGAYYVAVATDSGTVNQIILSVWD